MLLHGFVFALGFGFGTLCFCVMLGVSIFGVEKLTTCFRRSRETDGPTDIREWQEDAERKGVRKTPRISSWS